LAVGGVVFAEDFGAVFGLGGVQLLVGLLVLADFCWGWGDI
jgi:hypothetical protein